MIVDSWAFIEQAFDGPQSGQVGSILQKADRLTTVRDVVIETYSFIVNRGGGPQTADHWLERLKASNIRILDPRFSDIDRFHEGLPKDTGLSLVDVAVAWAASKEKTTDILTQDNGFRAVGLVPLCSGETR